MAQKYPTEQERIDAETMKIENPNRVLGSGYIQFPPQRPFAQPVHVQPPTITQYELGEERSRPQPHQARSQPTGASYQAPRGSYAGRAHSQQRGPGNVTQPGRQPPRGPLQQRSSQQYQHSQPGQVAASQPRGPAPYQQRDTAVPQQRPNRPPTRQPATLHQSAPAYQERTPQAAAHQHQQSSNYQQRAPQRHPVPDSRAQQTHAYGQPQQPQDRNAGDLLNGHPVQAGQAPASRPSARPPTHAAANGVVGSMAKLSVNDMGSQGDKVSKSQAKRMRKKTREGRAPAS